MEQNNHSEKFLRQRKFMLMLPLLVLPFITLFFVAMGGGKGSNISSGNPKVEGLNVKLPDAHFKKGKDKSKMSLYDEASKDSAILKEKIKNDPYYLLEYHNTELPDSLHTELQNILKHKDIKYEPAHIGENELYPELTGSKTDENEVKIMDKLEKLKSVIHLKTESLEPDPLSVIRSNPNTAQLEKLMSNLNNSRSHDPQMDQLNGILDKVMAIQHPETAEDNIRKLSVKNKQKVFPVNFKNEENVVSSLDTASRENNPIAIAGELNDFYSIDNGTTSNATKQNVIEAVINETQTLVSGDPITLRLLDDVFIDGIKIPKNELVSGSTSLEGERLKVTISSLSYQNNILPVSMEAYDMRGMAGIYIPGSVSRDASKQSAEQAISTIGLASMDPSLGAQAASAGIQAAKALMSKKIKLIKFTVNAGYHIFLKDNNQK